MLFFLKRMWFVVVDNWKVFAVIGGFLLVCFLVLFAYRGCTKDKGKLNEAEIQKAEEAIRQRNDKELREILANSDAREALIDSNIANAERDKVNALHEARKTYANMNATDLAAELERRK